MGCAYKNDEKFKNQFYLQLCSIGPFDQRLPKFSPTFIPRYTYPLLDKWDCWSKWSAHCCAIFERSYHRECVKLQNKKFISVDTISLFNESQDATKIWSGKKRKWNKMTFIFYGLCYSVTVNSIPKITLGFWDIRWLGWEGKIIWPSRLDIYTYQTCVHNTDFRNPNQVFIIHWIFVIGSKLFWVNYGVFPNKYIKR